MAARVRRAYDRLPAEQIVLATDCGMKYLPRESAEGKMAELIFFLPFGDRTFAVIRLRPCDAVHIRHHGRLIQPECGTTLKVMNQCPTEGLS